MSQLNNLTLIFIYFAQVTLNAEAQLEEFATNSGSLKSTNGERLFLSSEKQMALLLTSQLHHTSSVTCPL